jgi:hypothetical protein
MVMEGYVMIVLACETKLARGLESRVRDMKPWLGGAEGARPVSSPGWGLEKRAEGECLLFTRDCYVGASK